MGKIPVWHFSEMAVDSPMWTLFVKKGDGSTASVIEKREVFMVGLSLSRACIDKPSRL